MFALNMAMAIMAIMAKNGSYGYYGYGHLKVKHEIFLITPKRALKN